MTLPILLDVDGVLADFLGGYLHALWQITGTKFEREAVTQHEIADVLKLDEGTRHAMDSRILSKGFCMNLAPMAFACDSVNLLREVAPVVAVTAPWTGSQHWHSERVAWLNAYYRFEPKEIIFAAAKYKPLIAGLMLVDDRADTIEAWDEAQPGIAVLWQTGYNQGALEDNCRVRRTSDWSSVAAIARDLPVTWSDV